MTSLTRNKWIAFHNGRLLPDSTRARIVDATPSGRQFLHQDATGGATEKTVNAQITAHLRFIASAFEGMPG